MTSLSATNRFIKEQKAQLPPEAGPMLEQLRLTAKSIDAEVRTKGGVSGSLVGAYRLQFNDILAMLPKGKPADKKDELDALLDEHGA